MTKDIPLSKITPPVLPKVYLRTRLFRQLDKLQDRQLIWVEGPPGAGKTTLVCSYLDNRDIPYLWYQLDKEDSNSATFFHYLGLAGKKQISRKRQALPHLTPEYHDNELAFSRHFFKELFDRLQAPFALVLDNYQEISKDAKLHETLRECLGQLPPDSLIIAISRSNPPAALARIQTNQAMAVVGWKDLALTQDESKGIAKLWGLREPLKDVLSNLHGKVEDWAAGLVLILDSFNNGRLNPQALKDTSQIGLFDYFASEILEHTTPEEQEFLLKTAFLNNMTVPMAKTLTGNSNAGKILSSLNQHHYFTEQLAKSEVIYRYHPLFREFLITRAKQKFSPSQLTDIQNQAAILLEENGQTEAAVAMLMNTKNWEHLIPLVCKQAPQLLTQGRNQTLDE